MNPYRCCGTHLKTSCVYFFFAILIWIDQLLTLYHLSVSSWTSELLRSPVSHRYLRAFLASGLIHATNRRNRGKTGNGGLPPALTRRRFSRGLHLVLGPTLGTYHEIHENQWELRVARCFDFFLKSTCTSTSFWWAPNKPDVISIFGYKKERNYLT